MADYFDTPDVDVVDAFEIGDSNELATIDDALDDASNDAPIPMPKSVSRHSGADEAQFQAWLARIVRQDEAALNDLYRACIGRVYGLALRIVRIPALAEEVAEDCFWQVWRQAPRFEAARGTALPMPAMRIPESEKAVIGWLMRKAASGVADPRACSRGLRARRPI